MEGYLGSMLTEEWGGYPGREGGILGGRWLPWVHADGCHVHLVLALERVVAGRHVEEWDGAERAAHGEQRNHRLRLVRLRGLTVQELEAATDLQGLNKHGTCRVYTEKD